MTTAFKNYWKETDLKIIKTVEVKKEIKSISKEIMGLHKELSKSSKELSKGLSGYEYVETK